MEADRRPTGYLHPDYALSLGGFGEPLALPGSGGWLLRRPIGTTGRFDAMGCYPLFCCRDWAALAADLDACRQDLVSAVLVTDPMAEVEPSLLASCFGSVRPYKQNYVVDTTIFSEQAVGRSHRQQALRALRRVAVEQCPRPLDYLDEWVRLFGVLAARHAITGPRRFSREAFAQQLAVPGLVMFRAVAAGRTVGLDLWYLQDDVAQGHLAAFDEAGYELRAAYATKWELIRHLRDRVRWINLGAGTAADASDGLSYFKRGFSTGTRASWLCGRVFQPQVYADLAGARPGTTDNGYFPAYRAGEFS